jgi:hypothetical protein
MKAYIHYEQYTHANKYAIILFIPVKRGGWRRTLALRVTSQLVLPYGIRTTSYREILYFNDHDEAGDRVFISNGKRTNTRRDRERERRESASVARRRREASVYIHKQSWVETHLISICWSASLIN